MLGKQGLLELAETVLKASPADQTEVLVVASSEYLTRFAMNYIHQNVGVSDIMVRVRSFVGKKMGVAATNRATRESLAEVAKRAAQIARLQRETAEFTSLPGPQQHATVDAFDQATADCPPDRRAEAVATGISLAQARGCTAAGAFSTHADEVAVANSLGLRGYLPVTRADFNTVVMCGTGSGYAYGTARDVAGVDPAALAETAIGKAVASQHPIDIEPGEFTVVLSHEPVAEMVQFLAWLGFGAREFQEGRSFMAGKLGQKITGERITIWDDGIDPTGMPFPFDSEGVAKQKVMLIENGIARNVVYDTLTAARGATRTTGHSLGTGWHPYPTNLFMASGDSSVEKMIAATDRGLFVTRFHYVNVSEPMKTVLTGMTRDGTFLIEGGKLTKPVRNLRFTQSVLEALASADMISADTKVVDGDCRVPALRARSFRFSGATVAS